MRNSGQMINGMTHPTLVAARLSAPRCNDCNRVLQRVSNHLFWHHCEGLLIPAKKVQLACVIVKCKWRIIIWPWAITLSIKNSNFSKSEMNLVKSPWWWRRERRRVCFISWNHLSWSGNDKRSKRWGSSQTLNGRTWNWWYKRNVSHFIDSDNRWWRS